MLSLVVESRGCVGQDWGGRCHLSEEAASTSSTFLPSLLQSALPRASPLSCCVVETPWTGDTASSLHREQWLVSTGDTGRNHLWESSDQHPGGPGSPSSTHTRMCACQYLCKCQFTGSPCSPGYFYANASLSKVQFFICAFIYLK